MLASAAFALALLVAAAMGLALQRGATCTVAAMDEWVQQRRLSRLLALMEAALWVGAGLLLARAWGLQPALPQPPDIGSHALFGLSAWTLLGAVLLALGALANGACLLGTVARLGAGQWAYLATPAGFYAGCLTLPKWAQSSGTGATHAALAATAAAPATSDAAAATAATAAAANAATAATAASAATASAVPLLPAWAAGAVALALLLRLGFGLAPRWRQRAWHAPWSAHACTAAIGVAFLLLLLLAGGWAYTDVLAELARQMGHGNTGATTAIITTTSTTAPGGGTGQAAGVGLNAVSDLAPRLALLVALLAGALLGGWLTRQWQHQPPGWGAVARCLAGGWLMGWGSLLVPGGNDSLILLGLPLLWPHAWAAFAVMCAVIAGVLSLRARWPNQAAGKTQS